jgi:GT2 family glycosyltransferase
MTPVITLAIPVYNGARTLAEVLHAAGQQTCSPDEVLVIDDGSTDGSVELAKRCGARIICHPVNRGLASARNTALQEARGELIVFIDADARPHPGLIQQLSGGFEDQRVAAVGGQVLELGTMAAQLADRWRGIFWRQTQGESILPEAAFVVGACCCFRRRHALAVGGFSRSYPTNGEDVELSLRLRHEGWRLIYNPAAQVSHLRQDSLGSLLTMVYRHQRDHTRALRDLHSTVRPLWRNALRWGPVSIISSLHRHHSPALAGLSSLCYGASLAGCAMGVWRSLRDQT